MTSKREKFTAVHQMINVLEHDRDNLKKEIKKILAKNLPIILELGCGGGDYTLGLAKNWPKKIFIGVDIQGERLWHGAKKALEEKMENVLFIRDYVENITGYFPLKSIAEIWLTFPDPYPKKKQTKKRLVSPHFLKIYQKILKKDGTINLKTDSQNLLNYARESAKELKGKIIRSLVNIYRQKKLPQNLKITTFFEKKHLANNRTIHYLKFKL